jgi:hypothetical protein
MPVSGFTPRFDVQQAPARTPAPAWTRVAVMQGLYFLFTGLWPLLDIVTFQLVTGPKIDLWLVKTVGLLVAMIGAALTAAGLRRRLSAEIVALALGSAFALLVIDVRYALARRISAIYWVDALIEIGIIAAWVLPAVLRWAHGPAKRPAVSTTTSASAAGGNGRPHALSRADDLQ